MKHYLKKIFILLFYFSCISGAEITYEFSGGRFGDNLLAYMRTKWLSFKHNIPLIYKPFKYSEQLKLHILETQNNNPRKATKKELILSKKNMDINPLAPYLYIVPYFSDIAFERNLPWNRHWIYFEVDYDNKDFYRQITECITPIDPKVLEFDIPNNCISVAVHVRKGEGFDGPLLSESDRKEKMVNYADLNNALKFPPDYFYIEQLKKLSEIFNHEKIYAFIFTDVSNPQRILKKFKDKLLEYPNIELDCRGKTDKAHDSNVLEDFFAMTKFNCLIRPQSSFSIAAAKLAHYLVEIYPTKHHWNNNISVIEEVEIKQEKNYIVSKEKKYEF